MNSDKIEVSVQADLAKSAVGLISDEIKNHRAAIPSKYRKLYDRVLTGKASPREAIKLQCLACFGYCQSEMVQCNSYLCELYRYRPYQKSVKSSTESVQQSNRDDLSIVGS